MRFYGGTTLVDIFDNMKTVVLSHTATATVFNPKFLEYARARGFAVRACNVRKANEKGRVERRVRDLREAFFAARGFHSLDDLNAQLADWLERVQRARLVPADLEKRIVRDALVEERARLLPLPEHPAPTDLVRAIASGKTPYLRFDRNDYSIPHTHVRKTVSVVASETLVRVLDGTTEIARHVRSYDAGQQLEDERHLAALSTYKRKAREHRGRNRLFAVCSAAQAFLAEIALHGGHLGGTTSRLLRLLDLYGAPALDAALRDAHARGAFRAESVAHVLDQRRRAEGVKPIISVSLPDDPRVRDQVVHPHRLDAYDNLAARAANKDDDE